MINRKTLDLGDGTILIVDGSTCLLQHTTDGVTYQIELSADAVIHLAMALRLPDLPKPELEYPESPDYDYSIAGNDCIVYRIDENGARQKCEVASIDILVNTEELGCPDPHITLIHNSDVSIDLEQADKIIGFFGQNTNPNLQNSETTPNTKGMCHCRTNSMDLAVPCCGNYAGCQCGAV